MRICGYSSINVCTSGSTRTLIKPLRRWRGQVALVTGASAGIGWVVCQTLAAAGMRVVAVARRRDRLEALQQDLVASGIAITDFLPIVCDISKVTPALARAGALCALAVPGWQHAVLVGLGQSSYCRVWRCIQAPSCMQLLSASKGSISASDFSALITCRRRRW